MNFDFTFQLVKKNSFKTWVPYVTYNNKNCAVETLSSTVPSKTWIRLWLLANVCLKMLLHK